MICPNCETEHQNPKFCSRSCAATFNNKRFPKRKPESKCLDCDTPISRQRARCRPCYNVWLESRQVVDMTLGEAIYNNAHRSSAFALVRTRARTYAKKLGLDSCEFCGYNKHVEIAHIKPVSSFSEEVLLSEINHRDNIKALCPNCHWEFDHGLAPVVQ